MERIRNECVESDSLGSTVDAGALCRRRRRRRAALCPNLTLLSTELKLSSTTCLWHSRLIISILNSMSTVLCFY